MFDGNPNSKVDENKIVQWIGKLMVQVSDLGIFELYRVRQIKLLLFDGFNKGEDDNFADSLLEGDLDSKEVGCEDGICRTD